MASDYNIYCDESCHLENDHQNSMVLGAVWCPTSAVPTLNHGIKTLKAEHGLSSSFEIKWTKVSPSKKQFYKELVDYFFMNTDLHFRALVIPDKSKLNHALFSQDHDTWYFKMYFEMLKQIIHSDDHYNVYLDVKDTRSSKKVSKLHDVLSNNIGDFGKYHVAKVQTVRSHEISILQLADLLIGTVSYANRHLSTSPTKNELVSLMQKYLAHPLTQSTSLNSAKVNLLLWKASEV